MPYTFTFPKPCVPMLCAQVKSHLPGQTLASDSVQRHSLGTHDWCHLCRSPDETYNHWVCQVTASPNGHKWLPFLSSAPRRRVVRESELP